MNWTEQLHRFFRVHLPESVGRVKRGIYHFRREADGNITRFHLRVEEDGTGLLLANSSVAARLSPSGVLIAKSLLEERSIDEIVKAAQRNFRGVRLKQVKSDISKLQTFIETLANPEDNYPIFNLDDPSVSTPRSLFAPFHAQLRVDPFEQTDPLILEKLWQSGIVHVTIVATRMTEPEIVVRNVERAEDLGMISGVRAAASWLQTKDLMRRIAMAGVDYVVFPMISVDPQTQDDFFGKGDFGNTRICIEDCKKWEICPVAEIPLFRENIEDFEDLVQFLSTQGVKNVLYYALAELRPVQIIQAAVRVHELAGSTDVRYVWLPPINKSGNLTFIFDEGPRTGGDVSIRVEPDGSVYPPRGPMVAVGNLLKDDWHSIWNHEAFRRYRQRVESPTRCDLCPGLEICAADCPADPQGWASGGPS